MKTEKKKLFILLVLLFLFSGITQLRSKNISSLTISADEGWVNYEPISDSNYNSSNHELLVDSLNNIYAFWQEKDLINNNSQFVYQIQFTNGTKKTMTILELVDSTSYINYEVDIDSSDVIHLILVNGTDFTYYTKVQENFVLVNNFELVDVNNYCFIVADNIPHIIYSSSSGGNIFDYYYDGNMWKANQITNYIYDTELYIGVSYFPKVAKSIKGKIAICFHHELWGISSETEDIREIHLMTYDKDWSNPIIVDSGFVTNFGLDFDENEKLHLIWSDTGSAINYATYKRHLSDIETLTLYESSVTTYGYKAIFQFDIEVQGTTRLIAFTVSKFIEAMGFDYDLFLANSTNDEPWSTNIICSSNTSKTVNPVLESTKDGTVYVAAWEQGLVNYNDTINIGYKEEFFSYQPMSVNFEPIIVVITIPIILFIYKKKARK